MRLRKTVMALTATVATVTPLTLSAPAFAAPVFTGWTSLSPAQLAAHHGPVVAITPPSAPGGGGGTASPMYNNDISCAGYYTDAGEMQCLGVANTVNNAHVAMRRGFWDGQNGFGWSKAWEYHNLEGQPILDTIHYGIPGGSNSSRNYEVYHYNVQGELDQEVIVVADIQDNSFQGVDTPDGWAVGVLTGYCNYGTGSMEPECPDWVNQTL